MRKVLIISQNFYPEIGSAGNRIKNIYLLLKENNIEVDILTTDPTYPNRNLYKDGSFWDDYDLNEDTNIHRVKIKNKRYSRSIMNRLIYYLEIAIKFVYVILRKREKYDVVFVTSPPIFVAMVGLIAKFRYKAKLILDIRDLWPESLKGVGVFNFSIIIKLFRLIEMLLYKKANHIIVNSKGFIDYITSRSAMFKEKITYIPNGARNSEISNSISHQQEFKVIYAGNLGLAQDDAIIKKLAEELYFRNIGLTIVGYGLRREDFSEYVHKNCLNNVTFISPTTREKCLKIISEHQVGVVTLVDKDVFRTVLPGKIIDYMTCGIPIIGSVSGFSKDIIKNQQVGFVSDNHDINDLISFIEKIKGNKKLQKEINNNARRYVKNNFLWEKNIEVLVDVINSP
ncbi:glycosyltransferase family 4 protein [Oceanobacillus kapialis]|uniref:Glycosyltransferase family 4 protein n=1 Tax=Oceanobacillus kapialis TaxID=481353 RepID=A0ABW5PWT3_9BACI